MGHEYRILHILHCKFTEKCICTGEILGSYFPSYLYFVFLEICIFIFFLRQGLVYVSLVSHLLCSWRWLWPSDPLASFLQLQGWWAAPSCLVHVVLDTELRASCMLDSIVPTDIHLWLRYGFYMVYGFYVVHDKNININNKLLLTRI